MKKPNNEEEKKVLKAAMKLVDNLEASYPEKMHDEHFTKECRAAREKLNEVAKSLGISLRD